MLDRVFINLEWAARYSEWRVKILPRSGSDHSPIFGSSHQIAKPINAPFRFNNSWVNNETFKETVNTSWNQEFIGAPLITIMKSCKD